MTYIFTHIMKIKDQVYREQVYKTSYEKDAIRTARAYYNSFEQSPVCYHTLQVDGNFESLERLAAKPVKMDATLEDNRYKSVKTRNKKEKQ